MLIECHAHRTVSIHAGVAYRLCIAVCDRPEWRHLQYDRDQLFSLYTTADDPGAAVVAPLRSLGWYTVRRLRRPSARRRRRRTGHAEYPSSLQRDDGVSFRRYRGCRAGRSRRSPPIIRPTGCSAFVLVASENFPLLLRWIINFVPTFIWRIEAANGACTICDMDNPTRMSWTLTRSTRTIGCLRAYC